MHRQRLWSLAAVETRDMKNGELFCTRGLFDFPSHRTMKLTRTCDHHHVGEYAFCRKRDIAGVLSSRGVRLSSLGSIMNSPRVEGR